MPSRVPADVKEAVLKSVDDAVGPVGAHLGVRVVAGFRLPVTPLAGTAPRHRHPGRPAPGGHPVHALLSEEIAAVLDVAERWGTVDRSHRKLADRGS